MSRLPSSSATANTFDTERWHGEFIDWWGRAQQHGLAYAVLPDVVMRRLHAYNMTRRERDGRREYLSVLREQLARQRTLYEQAPINTQEQTA